VTIALATDSVIGWSAYRTVLLGAGTTPPAGAVTDALPDGCVELLQLAISSAAPILDRIPERIFIASTSSDGYPVGPSRQTLQIGHHVICRRPVARRSEWRNEQMTS
jgi:hypothetical protein